jgi:hypothetical protein
MAPWPRRLINFPIIMIVIVQQYIWAVTLLFDPTAHLATAVNVLFTTHEIIWTLAWPIEIPPDIPTVSIVLAAASTLAGASFLMRKTRSTVLMLLPQQFLLYVSAGGAFRAITEGHFADGVARSFGFLLVDQCLVFLVAFFHTWAIMLIMRYGADR